MMRPVDPLRADAIAKIAPVYVRERAHANVEFARLIDVGNDFDRIAGRVYRDEIILVRPLAVVLSGKTCATLPHTVTSW